MYLELLMSMLALQKLMFDSYEAANGDNGIGLFILTHQLSSLEFFDKTEPPAECRDLHRHCVNSLRISVQTLALQQQGSPVPDALLSEYEDVNQQLVSALAELRD